MTVLSRLFNKSDHAVLGDKSVKIPKLTPAKFRQMLERIEVLPQIMISVFDARHSESFALQAITGAALTFDEISGIVAALADLEPEYVAENASISEMVEFVRLTLEKNDLQATLKNFRAVVGMLRASKPADGGEING